MKNNKDLIPKSPKVIPVIGTYWKTNLKPFATVKVVYTNSIKVVVEYVDYTIDFGNINDFLEEYTFLQQGE
jgi:hypothetical protein